MRSSRGVRESRAPGGERFKIDFRGSFQGQPLLIATSRDSMLGGVFACMLGGAMARWLLWSSDPVDAALVFAALGPMGLVCLIKAWRPDRLSLSATGFRYETFLGVVVEAPWSDVGPFRLWKYQYGVASVVFDVSSEVRPTVRYQGMNKAFSGADVSLAGRWPVSSAQLVSLLNEARAFWLQEPSRPS